MYRNILLVCTCKFFLLLRYIYNIIIVGIVLNIYVLKYVHLCDNLEKNKAEWGLTKLQWDEFQILVSAMEQCVIYEDFLKIRSIAES